VQIPAALSGDHLTIYLNDHLAGSTFGVELARRCRASNRGNEFGPFLGELVAEIEADREELERIMDRLGRPRDRVKPAAGWLVEKLGRLKPNGRMLGYSPLSRLIELEGLSAGVQGKLRLWRALRAIAPREPRLSKAQLDGLIRRAEGQLEQLAANQARAAQLALSPGSAP
jgi:hypothetical protein